MSLLIICVRPTQTLGYVSNYANSITGVEEFSGKKRRTGDFVFSRQPAPIDESVSTSLPVQPPTARPIKPIHRSIPSPNTAAQHVGVDVQNGGDGGAPTWKNATLPVPDVEMDNASELEPRRFHMSRRSVQNPLETGKGRKRSASNGLTFMERRAKKLPSSTRGSGEAETMISDIAEDSPVETPRPRKKPGRSSRTQKTAEDGSITPQPSPKPSGKFQNIRLPNGKTMPWDVNSEELAAEMQAYTLQEIGKNIEQTNQLRSARDQQISTPQKTATPSRFKPTPPAQRWAERHPEEAARMNAMDVDEWASSEDESEYIIDTYVRMPANVVSGSPKNFGLLVLESQPDIDEFYLEEQESDDEDDEQDEDENGKSKHIFWVLNEG